MPSFRRLGPSVTAEIWNKPGDLDGDLPLVKGEGRIVKTYDRDTVDGSAMCPVCRKPAREHGWIDPPAPPVDPATAHLPVDLNTGEVVAPAVVQAVATFPQTWTKAVKTNGKPDTTETRDVQNPDDATQAGKDGFTEPAMAPAPAPGPVRASGDMKDKAPPTGPRTPIAPLSTTGDAPLPLSPPYPATYEKPATGETRVVDNKDTKGEDKAKEALDAGFKAPTVASDTAKTAWPQTYRKSGGSTKTVHSVEESRMAAASGFFPTVDEVPVDAPKGFVPVVYGKPGKPDMTVHFQAEQDEAIADGWAPKVAQAPAGNTEFTSGFVQPPAGTTNSGLAQSQGAGAVSSGLDPNRKDLEGLVVHPGWYVVTDDSTGERRVEGPPDQFHNYYVKSSLVGQK